MKTNPHRRIRGFSLIEVMIAVVVLSFGLLALAALQASLFRAGAETKARANATAIAQQVVENAKTFAFLSAPTGYTGNTYQGLTTAKLNNQTVGGVAYSVCRQVRRYRQDATTKKFAALNGVDAATCADTAAVGATFDPGTPEFKEVRVSVAWSGDAGQAKMVELTDSVAAISPADAIQVVKTPFATAGGPQVWIEPPNKNNPQVVPIGIGDGKSAASSNPKPVQFIDDVSSATLFSVQTFTGSRTDEVLLNRKLDVAAASCVCSETGAVSTAANPAYQPTTWNGKQLSYVEPLTAPIGKKIGVSILRDNSISQIKNLCQTCCRDHHDSSNQPLKVDPYRALTNGEHAHYGYAPEGGNGYNISGGLLPVSLANTDNKYVEACRLIRVGGLMRLAVDARQNHLMVTPLNAGSTPTNFENLNLTRLYSSFVAGTIDSNTNRNTGGYINEAIQNIPSNYPSAALSYPASPLPAPSPTLLRDYDDIVAPTTISLASGDVRKMVTFGLYVDYLTPETLQAYNCARNNNNVGSCAGLGTRSPLEYIPFYAVNVANLGNANSLGAAQPVAWTPSKATVVSVANTTFTQSGTLQTDGGIATAEPCAFASPVAVNQTINISNSGLAGTTSIDPDDAAVSPVVAAEQRRGSFAYDAQSFNKTAGSTTGVCAPQTNTVTMKIGRNSSINFNALTITGAGCSGGVCTFNAPTSPTTTTISFSITGFTSRQNANAPIVNREVCFPAEASGITRVLDGQTAETVNATIGPLGAANYILTFNVVDEQGSSTNCSNVSPAASLVVVP